MGYIIYSTLIFLSSLIFWFLFRNKNGIPTNWPIVGMVPALIINFHRFYEFYIEGLEKSNMTFHFKGPWFTNLDILTTVDPTNLHHILSKRSDNYEKGSKLREVLEALGDGILNTDSTTWKYHHTVALSFLNQPSFYPSLVFVTWQKVQNGLFPLLDHVSKRGIEIDLQDILLRFMYDTICVVMMGYDPTSLSIDLPQIPFLKAVEDLEHVMLYREVLPTRVWKFMRWLNVGIEKKQKPGLKVLDDFIYKCINMKREELMKKPSSSTSLKEDDNVMRVDLLTAFITDKDMGCNNDKFLRDTILNFFVAGMETSSTALTWLFYLLSKNPQVVRKIKLELKENNVMNDDYYNSFIVNFKEISTKLNYLHATLCETLRLYPSVVFNIKAPINSDVLPSGHEITPNTQIVYCMYGMGRIKSVWGDDCYEFKPERWIDEDGNLKKVSSSKFSAFSEGPRSCLGKKIAFTQMKIVAATIIQNYDIEVIEGYQHAPDIAVVLHMRNGFKVKVHHSQ